MHDALTRSRKLINVFASLPWKLLAAIILDWELKRDRSFREHSSESVSRVQSSDQDCASNEHRGQ